MVREFIISAGFGAGWSTWNSEHEDFLLFDKKLIELCKSKASLEAVDEYLKSKGMNIYMGGWDGCYVETIEDDEVFIVEEYDGAESVRYKNSENWK